MTFILFLLVHTVLAKMGFELSGQTSSQDKFTYRFRLQNDSFEVTIQSSTTESAVKKADGFLFMCSLTDYGSLRDLRDKYYKYIVNKRGTVSFPMYLLCNKSDLTTERTVDYSDISSFCFSNSCSYKEISVRNGYNLHEAIQEFVVAIISCKKRLAPVSEPSIINRLFTSVSNSADMEDDLGTFSHIR
jgi:GTPase SAR1 family protein